MVRRAAKRTRALAAALSAALILLLAGSTIRIHPSLLVEARHPSSFHTTAYRALHGKGKSTSKKGATDDYEALGGDPTNSTAVVESSSSKGKGKAGGKSGKKKSSKSKSSSSDDLVFTNSTSSSSSKSSKKKKGCKSSSSDDGTYAPTSTPAPTGLDSSSKVKSDKGKKKDSKKGRVGTDRPQPTAAPVVLPLVAPVGAPSLTTLAPAAGATPETVAPNPSGTATPIAPVTLQPVAAGATAAPTPTFGIGDLTDAPTIAIATATPVAAGATETPVVAGATEAPVTAGTTSAPVAAGETSAPIAAGATTAPVVAGASPAPTPSFGTGDLTEAPAVAGATTPSPTSVGGDLGTPQPTPVTGLNITVKSGAVPDDDVFEVSASPFRVKYSMPSASKSVDEKEMEEVTILTLKFVGDALSEVFKITNDENIDFEYVVGGRTAVSSNFEIFDYEIAASFHPMTEIVPLMTDLDALLANIVFQEPANKTLLLLLKNLPKNNPYSTTTRIFYEKVSDVSSSSSDSDGLGVSGIISIAGAFVLAFVATGMAIAHRTGCIKTMGSRGALRNKTLSIAHLTDKTNQEPSVHDETPGDYDYTSSLESSSLVDHKNHADDRGPRVADEEQIDFEYPKRFRKGAYVEPKGLFDAPFEEREKYAEIPKRDEV